MVREKRLYVNSMVGSKDHEPYVTLRLGEEASQLDCAEARRIGLWLIEAAESAEHDAWLIKYLVEHGWDLPQAAHILSSLRERRPKA